MHVYILLLAGTTAGQIWDHHESQEQCVLTDCKSLVLVTVLYALTNLCHKLSLHCTSSFLFLDFSAYALS